MQRLLLRVHCLEQQQRLALSFATVQASAVAAAAQVTGDYWATAEVSEILGYIQVMMIGEGPGEAEEYFRIDELGRDKERRGKAVP
jgi:hypothetical protein